MDAISPQGRIAGLHTPVFLLHGSQDVVVPPTEMAWLAHDLPPGDLRGELATPALSHVSTEPAITLRDKWQLIHFLAHVLEAASA
jgi:pimeloyl-ACP methyl ester carboxylesterase